MNFEIDRSQPLVREKRRFLNESKLNFASKALNEMLESGILAECYDSQLCANLVLVPKSLGRTRSEIYQNKLDRVEDNNYRLAIDYKYLNTKLLDQTPPSFSFITEIISKLSGKLVTCLDFINAFYHIKLDPSCQKYTAFYFKNRILYFQRLPQGLSKSPSFFSAFVKTVFSKKSFEKALIHFPKYRELLKKHNISDYADFLETYFDDIFIYNEITDDRQENFRLHSALLEISFFTMKEFKIKISGAKCTYFSTKLRILGTLLDTKNSERSIDICKAKSILGWPKPMCLADLQSKICTLTFHFQHLPNLKEIIAPLYNLLKTNRFTWDSYLDLSWARIKALILADIRLTIPGRDEQLILSCDASQSSTAQCLFILKPTGDLKIAGLNSKLFSSCDIKKNIYHKELLSLAQGLKNFYDEISGSRKSLIVLTDCRNLVYLNKSKSISILSRELVNYITLVLKLNDVRILHTPGKLNLLSDIFSRSFERSNYIRENSYIFDLEKITVPFIEKGVTMNSNFLLEYFSKEIKPTFKEAKRKMSKPETVQSILKYYSNLPPELSFVTSMYLMKKLTDYQYRMKIQSLKN